jgi:hypothetical protein
MTNPRRKKLNEKELGSLYLLSNAPMMVDRALQSGDFTDQDLAGMHETLGGHAPDMAMIAISLSGNMLAEAMKQTGEDHLLPLATELKYLSVNTVEEVGRIWIDACRYGIHNQDDINDTVNQSADILCMLASIFMEISEACTPEPGTIRGVAATLMYQAEAHADSARALLDNAAPQPSKTSMDAIPLPKELQNRHYTDNVVAFSLFGDQRMQ